MAFFFASKSIWDGTVSYWFPSVASFVAFLCVCTCGDAVSLFFCCQNGARVGLDG